MSINIFHGIRVSGIAGAVPKTMIDNQKFAAVLDKETVERVISVTGVKTHFKSDQKQTAGDLGFAAAENVIAKKQLITSEIGLLIDITETPDYIAPSTAFVLHKRLNLSQNCMAFDINLGCTGFVYGLHIATALLKSIQSRYALIVLGNVNNMPERIQKKQRANPDHTNLMMLGDGCAAVLLEKTEDDSQIATELYGDGTDFHLIHTMGRCRGMDLADDVTTWSDGIDRSVFDPYMDGMGVFAFATRQAPKCIKHFLDKENSSLEDYEEVYLHQANKMIVDRIAKLLKLSPEKVPISLDKYGNTSSASIPITLINRYEGVHSDKKIRILSCAFGVGLSWGCASLEIRPNDIFPMIYTDAYYDDGEFNFIK